MTNNLAGISAHLRSELDRLISLTIQIRQSGGVAPANCWITETSQTRNGRVYRYARLVSENPQIKGFSLGRPLSPNVVDWQQRCQRRDAIQEIEQQIRMLTELIDRQVARPIEFSVEVKQEVEAA